MVAFDARRLKAETVHGAGKGGSTGSSGKRSLGNYAFNRLDGDKESIEFCLEPCEKTTAPEGARNLWTSGHLAAGVAVKSPEVSTFDWH